MYSLYTHSNKAGRARMPNTHRHATFSPPNGAERGPSMRNDRAADRKMPKPPAAMFTTATEEPRYFVDTNSLTIVKPAFSSPPRPIPTISRPKYKTSMFGANAPM